MDIIENTRSWLRRTSLLNIIIVINVVVFVALNIALLMQLSYGSNDLDAGRYLGLDSNLVLLLWRPWTPITYMFAHIGFSHILLNMLWLYWLGRVFLEYFTPKQFATLYLMGGLVGGALYMLVYNLIPHLSGHSDYLLGASAAIYAVVIATAVYAPNHKVDLLFFEELPLICVAVFPFVFDLLTLGGINFGGTLSHMGGVLVGVWFGLAIRRGTDITRPLTALLDRIATMLRPRRTHGNVVGHPIAGRAFKRNEAVDEQRLDDVLAKITRSGYASLTQEEKDVLNRASQQH